MLILPRYMHEQMNYHAGVERPYEACGLIAGKEGLPTRFIRMENVSDLPTKNFQFEAHAQHAWLQEIEDAGEELLAVFHSHPRGGPEMSREDISRAEVIQSEWYPNGGGEVLWIVYSLSSRTQKAWRVEAPGTGSTWEVEMSITDRPDVHNPDSVCKKLSA